MRGEFGNFKSKNFGLVVGTSNNYILTKGDLDDVMDPYNEEV